MKLLRVFMVVALLAVPLLASEALADFTANLYDVPYARVSATTVNQPIIGFAIPTNLGSTARDTLKTLNLKSFMERAYSVIQVKLWAESDASLPGWQATDNHLITYTLNGDRFETEDVIFMNVNRLLRDQSVATLDTFYITIDAYTSEVNLTPEEYDTKGLEIVIEAGYIVVGASDQRHVNDNRVANGGYVPEVPDPLQPAYFTEFKLVFDTQGPPLSMLWCFALETCKLDTIDQLDSLCIRADTTALSGPGDAIKGNITINLSEFGLSSTFALKPGSGLTGEDCFGEAPAGWDSCFLIPDKRFTGCIDVDSGHVIYATAQDSAGNVTTAPLYFDKPIDTCKPKFDEVSVGVPKIEFYIAYDANDDGIAAIGDSLAIVVWAMTNADFEVDSMIANLSAYFPNSLDDSWQVLDDVLNNNRLFRKKFILTEQPLGVEMTADSMYNRITVWAWDNACNYDTAQKMLNAPVDLTRPSFVECFYYYHWDIDTFDCIGIGDSVLIGADLSGASDLFSVTCDMVEAGIYGVQNQSLFDDGDLAVHGDGTADDAIYNLLWEVGEPPIADGKDTNNTEPPPIDYNYTVLLRAEDTAGNWDTCRTPRLNRILDTRRPRWTNQEKMYIKQMPDAKLAIYWPTSQSTPANSCNERDALFFYIYVDSGDGYGTTPFGATFNTEYKPDTNMWISEKLTDGKFYKFMLKQEDDCGNYSLFSKEMGMMADGTPPHVCIAVPDSGLTFGGPFMLKAVADSTSHDVDSVCVWYRFRRDLEDSMLPKGPWDQCFDCCCMTKAADGWVFTQEIDCIQDYIGWVELITVACDLAGNCQDTTMGYDDACLVMSDDTFRPGNFLFYWDTLAPAVSVIEVDGFPSPQTTCGYDVWFDSLNWVVIDVEGAGSELFEVEVRALGDDDDFRIFHQDNCAMPCTVWFDIQGWNEGTQNLYFYVKDYDNGHEGNAQVQVCVPPAPPENCIYISWPTEWMRIPCTGTSGYNCVELEASVYEYSQCMGVNFTEARFQWSPTGSDPWYTIDDVVEDVGPWYTCWDNTDLVEHGDTIYFRVIAHDEYYMADTSYMVKVFVDCEQPNVSLRIEELYYTCGDGIPKVSCDPLVLKAIVEDTEVDLDDVAFFVKRHSDPDIWDFWHRINDGEPAWSDNIWMYFWEEPCCGDIAKRDGCMEPNDFWDIRIAARDISGNYMFDYDEDSHFDDATFNDAVAAGAGFTVFVDDDAPEPAFTKVCDMGQEPPICIVNPSSNVDGIDKAYAQAGNDIYVEISPLPSEDTCTVMKVEYYLKIYGDWVHVGTSTDPVHYPITFNPLAQGLIRPVFFEDGWWKGDFKAELYDSLGNTEEDWIDLYILDVTPTQAVIIEPLNDSYVSGDVTLNIAAINSFEICKVCYEYSADGETWMPIECVYADLGDKHECDHFESTWHTLNTMADGDYYLRAVATDCDNNVDENPATIKVTVANEIPTVVLEDPRICERECSDSPLDTLGYVSGTVTLYATASSTAPIEYVKFWYKDVFDPKFFFTEIGRDYFPTDGKYSIEWNTGMLSDGRYQVKAEVHNIAGQWGQSLPPVTVSVDNSEPFAMITSVMGEPVPPDGIDITLGDVIDIELVAIDSTSDDGWTRCYNSGLVGIQVCIDECDMYKNGDVETKCFEVSPATDGFHTVQWNTSGLTLNVDDCTGCYEFYVKAWDCLGNLYESNGVVVNVYDIKAPVTTIGGFDGNYIYGYSTEELSSLQFQYADSGSNVWTPIGLSEFVTDCGYYLYKTTWDPARTFNVDGTYKVRVISHDACSNQDDDMAPVAYIHMNGGTLTPYSPNNLMGPMSFLKNWCVGGMHGVVLQDVQSGTPVMIGRYIGSGGYTYECIDMQANLQNSESFAGSFYARAIDDGGSAKFFSSVTMLIQPPPTTGAEKVTYLSTGTFDVATVYSNLGTHGTYQNGCVDLTIPDGAVDLDARHVWVAPTYMEWAPVNQPDILPIGDNDGFATYISFTDCYYCCGWLSPYFGEQEIPAAGAGTMHGDCCFREGKYAKIKMCYNEEINVAAEHLAVAWWDCDEGEYSFDGIYYPATVEGFDTENHTVEFAVECLSGPFVVVQLIERPCEGSISVNMLNIEPYCNGYTWPWPNFTAKITDRVQGTEGIDQESIIFKVGEEGDLTTIYNGAYEDCDAWARGYGQYPDAGYDLVSGFFRAGWNDPDYYWTTYYTQSDPSLCPECKYSHMTNYLKYFYCPPAPGLAAGDGYVASVTAQNYNIQTCTATMEFSVDATAPTVRFADTKGAYVAGNPNFYIYFKDAEAGLDKSSIWIDIWGDETNSPDPNSHQHIGTLPPAQLNWVNDSTVSVDGTFEYYGGYLHVYVYGGPDCLCVDCTYPQYYYYKCGIEDCVGNKTNVFWQYFTVDADKPIITLDECNDPLKFQITDALSGVVSVAVYEDGVLTDGFIIQDEVNPEYWWYTPSSGAKKADIKATDKVGNIATNSFSLPVDCDGPSVRFGDEYVCKNPTIEFWVTDPAGVDWSTVNVYINGCGESCYYLADDLGDYTNTETGKVTLSGCNLECNDGNSIGVYVYSGTSYTGNGPMDVNGNYGKYRYCSFVVDAYVPIISNSALDERPVVFTITDAKSGVDWSSFQFIEDGVVICDGTSCTDDAVTINTETGKVTYDPASGGAEIEIRVNDMTGCNLKTANYDVGYTADDALFFTEPHNYPNPFDPSDGGVTSIDPGLSKSCYVTVKIYDFAGEFVRELQNNKWTTTSANITWDGTTDEGTDVANGTYLCYIYASCDGSTKTAVIKITVLREDE
jgi:hypothetical protein